jgi:hypothetical protein
MLKVDTREIKRYERDLKEFASRAYPFATKQTINKAAFHSQKEAKSEVSKNMIERNRFTSQSIRVVQSRTLKVDRQSATMGSTAAYMETQEFGGVKRKTGKHGVALTTSYASGEGMGTQPRKRLAKKANRLQNILLSKAKTKSKNRRQRNAIIIKRAAEQGIDHVVLNLRGGKRGIFRVIGDDSGVDNIRMVHDISRKTVLIKPNPWMRPAVKRTTPLMQGFYRDALVFQLKRQGIFKK